MDAVHAQALLIRQCLAGLLSNELPTGSLLQQCLDGQLYRLHTTRPKRTSQPRQHPLCHISPLSCCSCCLLSRDPASISCICPGLSCLFRLKSCVCISESYRRTQTCSMGH